MLRRYIVECRQGYELWDNWYGDYVFCADEFTAIELVKQWCVENGADIEDVIFKVNEV